MWRHESSGLASDGSVSLRFRRRADDALVVVMVDRPGRAARALLRTPFGDFWYGRTEKVTPAEAGAFVRALADRFVHEGWAGELPHLSAVDEHRDGDDARDGSSVAARTLAELLVAELGGGVEIEQHAAGVYRALVAPRAGAVTAERVAILVGDLPDGLVAGDGVRACPERRDHIESVLGASRVAAALIRRAAGRQRSGLAMAEAAIEAAPGRTPRDAVLPELESHVFALRASGYTVIPGVLEPDHVRELRGIAAAALDRALEAERESGLLPQTIVEVHDPETFVLNRALYCWGEACIRLLEHPLIEQLASLVMGPHRLHEMAAQMAVPAPHVDPARTERWHRDVDLPERGDTVRYLWFMFPVDPFTADNGATWIVPGSQSLPDREIPRTRVSERFPTRRQILSSPGDLVVVDPMALHTWGHNRTAAPRRMLNVMLCAPGTTTVLDHWSIAGPALRRSASARVRALLAEPTSPALEPAWAALPPGHPAGAGDAP